MIAQKNFLTILIATIAVSAVIIINPISDDESDYTHFTFDAVYLKNDTSVLITFSDETKKSSFAILEILGMEKTFHKEFEITDSSFSKFVSLDNVPKYGWKTTPVTLEITYDEFNTIKMKTEIHDEDKIHPGIIFGSDD
ncbi:MAG: hypothetical protein H8E89_07385 [Candidatus Nitrosopelagicus sp.]|nr:hypothetical protein [Candidatus Nitrosopelagicus sp.]